MAAAMASLRAELGAEALILATRRTREGVEITAALEPDVIPPDPIPEPRMAAMPENFGRAALLRHHAVPAALWDALGAGALEDALARLFTFQTLDLPNQTPPLLLLGPPGAGKTLTVARLATRLVLAGINPLVISADGRRAGAAEQLGAFTRLLGVNLVIASHPVTLARALAGRAPDVPALIDTPGIDLYDPVQREEIAELAAAAQATPALVLPAGLDAAESADMADAARHLGSKQLIGTRFDMARRLGGMLGAARQGLALTEAGIGPGAADGLAPLTPAFLAEKLASTAAAAA